MINNSGEDHQVQKKGLPDPNSNFLGTNESGYIMQNTNLNTKSDAHFGPDA